MAWESRIQGYYQRKGGICQQANFDVLVTSHVRFHVYPHSVNQQFTGNTTSTTFELLVSIEWVDN